MKPGRGLRAVALLLVLAGGFSAAPARAGIVKLTILHTNDFHGRLDRADALLATIQGLRATHPQSLLLDAGDSFESKLPGAVESGGSAVVDFMNRAGYDGYTPGDNEFVLFRLADVLANIQRFRFPTISSNLRVKGAPLGVPFVIYERGGAKLAVIGVYGDHKSLAQFGVEELSSKKSVRRYVAELAGKVDCLVLLSHAGVDRERTYAKTIPGLDVIIGGSSHAPLPPEVVGGAVIVRAQSHGAAVGVLDLEIDTVAKKLHAWHFERVATPVAAPAPIAAPAEAPR
jgi:5'-nucleotidase